MKRRILKTVKILSIAIGSLLAVVLAGIAIAINFVFTPEKLTPVVLDLANESLNAQLDMKKVELTFFSTFPRFGLSVEDGTLVSKSVRDSLWERTDTLAAFRKCVAVVNPFDYLFHKHVNVKKLELDGASVYAYMSPEGKATWDILKPSVEDEPEDEEESASLVDGILVDRVRLKDAEVVFDDRQTGIYASLQDVDMSLRAVLKKMRVMLKLDFSNGNTIFWQNGQLLVNKVAVDMKTLLDLDTREGLVKLDDTRLSVNGIDLDLNGSMKKVDTSRTVYTDLVYSLHAPSLETVMGMIPESVVKKESLKAKGDVLVQGDVKGLYGSGQLPEATLHIQIKEASARYGRMKYGIDDLEMDFNAYVDLMRQRPSFADLQIFRFEGARTHILADARIDDLLGNAYVTFNTKSDIDLEALSETFPLQEGVEIGGKLDADLHLGCLVSSILKQDFGKAGIKGKLEMKQLSLKDLQHDFDFSSDAVLTFSGDKGLDADFQINRVKLNSPEVVSSIDRMSARVYSENLENDLEDSTRIADVICKLEVNAWGGSRGDSLSVSGQRIKATAHLRPSKDNAAMPEMLLSIGTDSLKCALGNVNIAMNKGGFEILSTKLNDSTWNHGGVIGFDYLQMETPDFGLPVNLQKTGVMLERKNIRLKNARADVGASDMVLSGILYDVFASLKNKTTLRGELSISSDRIDCNQLIAALDGRKEEDVAAISQDAAEMDLSDDTSAGDAAEADTTAAGSQMKLFVIPAEVDFRLQTDIAEVIYGDEVFENVQGTVNIREQKIHLDNLKLRGLDADMSASLIYEAKDTTEAYAGFDLRFSKVDVGRLMGMMSSLDSLVPMMKSLDGSVDFEVAAESKLGPDMTPVIPTLKSAVYLKGDSLVLMDSETFAEISKMLMFKNKERNMVDSLAVNILVEDGNVTIPPFPLLIDRYKVAVGGKQDLDMNLDYHISVLKSPIVIKLGVNIKGNLDDIDFGMGRAKYKKEVSADKTRKSDSLRVVLRDKIVSDFEKRLKDIYE